MPAWAPLGAYAAPERFPAPLPSETMRPSGSTSFSMPKPEPKATGAPKLTPPSPEVATYWL